MLTQTQWQQLRENFHSSSLPILKDLWNHLMYSIHGWEGVGGTEKREKIAKWRNFPFSFSSRRCSGEKLNWKFSIIYIWGVSRAPNLSLPPCCSETFFSIFLMKTLLCCTRERLECARVWVAEKWRQQIIFLYAINSSLRARCAVENMKIGNFVIVHFSLYLLTLTVWRWQRKKMDGKKSFGATITG